MTKQIDVSVRVERKQVDLPRYAVVPAPLLDPWEPTGTTTVDVEMNGVAVSRRTIKRWDDDRWFLSVTEQDCRRLGIDTGSMIALSLRLASEELPEELSALLRDDRSAAAAWGRLTASQQRMLRDEIAAAKRPETRARRAKRALVGSS